MLAIKACNEFWFSAKQASNPVSSRIACATAVPRERSSAMNWPQLIKDVRLAPRPLAVHAELQLHLSEQRVGYFL
jgi:hypothetical protein